jgi:hypothetical protein
MADRKGSYTTMETYRPIRTEAGTATFPNAKEYQKMKAGGCELQEDQQDFYMENSTREELRDTMVQSDDERLETGSSETESSETAS